MHQSAKMRTTLDINDATLDALKERAASQRKSLREVVEDVLQLGLAVQPGHDEAVDFPTFAVGIKGAYRGMSLNQLYDQIESESQMKVAEK
jgi:hypothetical protein